MSRAAPGCVSSLLRTDPTACIRYAHCPHCTSEPFPPPLLSSPAVEAPGGAATGLLWIPIISPRKLCRIKAFALVPSTCLHKCPQPHPTPATFILCPSYSVIRPLCFCTSPECPCRWWPLANSYTSFVSQFRFPVKPFSLLLPVSPLYSP